MVFDNIILVGAILIFVSIVVGKAGSRFGIPSLLLFLFVGMLFGTDGLGIEFDNAALTQFIGAIALTIILFSGGMDTQLSSIKPIWKQGIMLSTLGVLLTALVTGIFIYWISGFKWTNIYMPLATSILLASTASSTDSASVFNILRSQNIRLKYNLKSTLEFESGSNDPMAYMLTIAFIQAASSSSADSNIVHIVASFIKQFVIGGAFGYLGGKGMVWIMNKINVQAESLYSLMIMSLALFTFSMTDLIGGNGYLAVYIAGIMVGNKKIVHKKEITKYFDGMTMLFQIVMFLILGLLVNPSQMIKILPCGIIISIFMILVARPISVFISLLPFRRLRPRAKLFISWVGLRGAVPIIFATYPVVAGVEYSDQIFNIVFLITLISLTVQGMTIPYAARKLKLALPGKPHSIENFGLEIPEYINANLHEMTLTPKLLEKGNTLKEITLPEHTLVILIKRGDGYLVPNGKIELFSGDKLLLIYQEENA